MELPDPPEGWALKSLIEIDEGSWSVQLWATEEYVYGYGSSGRYAMCDAIDRIHVGETFERLSGMRPVKIDLVKALGIAKPKMERRF